VPIQHPDRPRSSARAWWRGRKSAGGIDRRAGQTSALAGQTLAAFLGLAAFLADFAFLAGAAEDFRAVAVEDFGVVATADFAVVPAGFDAAGLDAAVRDAAGLAAVLADLVLLAVPVADVADSPLAALLSEVTAVSRALVAVLIAVSAVVSALADVPAWVAAVFSLVAAVVTLVAAAETVRGVAALVRLAVALLPLVLLVLLLPLVLLAVTAAVLLAAVLPAPFLLAAVLLAPVLLAPVLLVAGRAAVRVLAAVAGLAAAERVAGGLLAVSVVPGMVAVVFVGTDLPPDMDQLRGRHSTESNLLHLMTRKNKWEDSDIRDHGSFVVPGKQPAHDPQRLLRRRTAADRDPHQITGQRHRQPHHAMRDLPGQRQQLVLRGLRQHLLHRHPEFRPDRPQPRPKISHAPRSFHPSRQPAPADNQTPPA
jgi:hypothetical protein